MYFLIPSFSLSLLHSSEVLLHSSTSSCQTTPTTEMQLLQLTLPEQTPVIDLSSPTTLSKWSYYFGESCSTSCRPKIPCLTCLNQFISFHEFSIFLSHTHPTFMLIWLSVFEDKRRRSMVFSAASPSVFPPTKSWSNKKKKVFYVQGSRGMSAQS